jgi:hypothetical protein
MVEHAPFRDFVFHLFADRIGELMQLVEEVAFARLDQRLAKLLLARNEATLNVTHQQLADELGSVREIVSRLLKGFAAQGLVSLGREQVAIVDREGLQKLALCDPGYIRSNADRMWHCPQHLTEKTSWLQMLAESTKSCVSLPAPA